MDKNVPIDRSRSAPVMADNLVRGILAIGGTTDVLVLTEEDKPVAVVLTPSHYNWLRRKVDGLIERGEI